MQYEMPALSEEQKEKLIEFIRGEQEMWTVEGDYSTVLRIALASLTAEPVGYTVVTGAGNTLFRKHRPRLRVTNEAPVEVYAAPPISPEPAC